MPWMVIKLKNIFSKIFLLNHEDVAVFNSGISFPRSQFVKIDVPFDVASVFVPIKMEFHEDKTSEHNCNRKDTDRKGTVLLLIHCDNQQWILRGD